jgi:hypothetical protein
MVTVSSLSAGALHYLLGWRAVNIGVLLPIALILGALLWLRSQQRVDSAATVAAPAPEPTKPE